MDHLILNGNPAYSSVIQISKKGSLREEAKANLQVDTCGCFSFDDS